jgi:two-component system, response regulator PdtaR
MKVLKILIVDDDFMVADCLEETLTDAGYEVCGIAGTVEDAIALGDAHQPDLGVIDLRLACGRFGTEVAAVLRRRHKFGVLYATGNPDHLTLREAEGEGYIGKPYTSEAILAALRCVAEQMAASDASMIRRPVDLVSRAA